MSAIGGSGHSTHTRGGQKMKVSAKRMAVLREHVRAESEHDMEALLSGMTPDCFNDVVGAPTPFVGPAQTAERYRRHWEGFPDFTVRVRRVLCADESCVVTENEWRGTHLGTFLGWPATGKPVKVRAVVVWHFKGDDLWGETIFFDNASLLKQIGAGIDIPPASGSSRPRSRSTIAADMPAFEAYQIWYVIGVVGLNAASRALDHLIAGPLPLQSGAALQKPRG